MIPVYKPQKRPRANEECRRRAMGATPETPGREGERHPLSQTMLEPPRMHKQEREAEQLGCILFNLAIEMVNLLFFFCDLACFAVITLRLLTTSPLPSLSGLWGFSFGRAWGFSFALTTGF